MWTGTAEIRAITVLDIVETRDILDSLFDHDLLKTVEDRYRPRLLESLYNYVVNSRYMSYFKELDIVEPEVIIDEMFLYLNILNSNGEVKAKYSVLEEAYLFIEDARLAIENQDEIMYNLFTKVNDPVLCHYTNPIWRFKAMNRRTGVFQLMGDVRCILWDRMKPLAVYE